jgi:hypothetical protein
MTTDVLDLGTMAVLAGTVALGLEKVRMEGDSLAEQVRKLEERISEAITLFDVEISTVDPVTGKRKIAEVCNNRQFHYLLRVARNLERMNYPRQQRCEYRRRPSYFSAVLLNWMRTGWHIYLLYGLTVLSLVCFLFQKAGQVYGFDHVKPMGTFVFWELQDICLFWIYMTTLIATLVFATIAHILATVGPRCDRYIRALTISKRKIDDRAKAEMMREVLAYTGKGEPPRPR